jgi:hypothetical protein
VRPAPLACRIAHGAESELDHELGEDLEQELPDARDDDFGQYFDGVAP